MKRLFFNKYFIVLIVLFVCFLPAAITQEAESESDAIVTALGVDYLPESDNVEVSMQIIVPTPSAQFSQNLSVVSVVDKSVSRASSALQLRLGKYISFPHCKAIVFNEAAISQGIEKHLDFVIRNKANGNNIVLLGTKESAKEMLNSISDIDNSLYFSLNNSGGFNKEYVKGVQLSLGNFYKRYQSKDSSCLIGNVSLESAKDVGMVSIPSSSGGESGGGSGSSSKPQKTVVNKGESMLLKNGKKVLSLTPDQSTGFNWFNKQSTKGFLLVENVNDHLYKDATVGIEIERKETKFDTYFDGKTPVFRVTNRLYIRVAEIIENAKDDEIYNENHAYLTPALKEKIKAKVSKTFDEVVSIAKEHNTDIMDAGKTLNKYNNKSYKKYLKKNSENPLKNIRFEHKIIVKERM